jgi:hypothetical protein
MLFPPKGFWGYPVCWFLEYPQAYPQKFWISAYHDEHCRTTEKEKALISQGF